MKPGESTANRLRKLGLDRTQIALVMEFSRAEPFAHLKHLPIPLQGPRPLDEAISVAGGIAWDALTPDLELKALPNIFAAGEMLDWEAPTGGYLLTASWATGRWAGKPPAPARDPAPDVIRGLPDPRGPGSSPGRVFQMQRLEPRQHLLAQDLHRQVQTLRPLQHVDERQASPDR